MSLVLYARRAPTMGSIEDDLEGLDGSGVVSSTLPEPAGISGAASGAPSSSWTDSLGGIFKSVLSGAFSSGTPAYRPPVQSAAPSVLPWVLGLGALGVGAFLIFRRRRA